MIQGNQVPIGTEIGTPIYALHHDSNTFLDPYLFKPERWLKGGTSREAPLRVFNTGPHKCNGRSFALKEMSIVLAKVIWKLDYRRPQRALKLFGWATDMLGLIGRTVMSFNCMITSLVQAKVPILNSA